MSRTRRTQQPSAPAVQPPTPHEQVIDVLLGGPSAYNALAMVGILAKANPSMFMELHLQTRVNPPEILEWMTVVSTLAASGELVSAIRNLRMNIACGLREGKDMVDAFRSYITNGTPPPDTFENKAHRAVVQKLILAHEAKSGK